MTNIRIKATFIFGQLDSQLSFIQVTHMHAVWHVEDAKAESNTHDFHFTSCDK